jgi:putative ATP-dependent endonuclease of the OLD family
MRRIADLRIKNFRGVQQGHIRFGRHTVLVGAGNVGKTTIIEALALLFGRDRLVRELTEHDFTGSCPVPADRIEVVATVTDFPGSQDPADHHEWFRDGRGVHKFLDPISGQLHATHDRPEWSLACQVGFQARFDQDALEVETVRYFHDHDGGMDPFDGDGGTILFPAKLVAQVGFYLVRASRTWDGVLSFGSELFRRTIRAAKGQPADAILSERDRLRQPANPIEEDPKLQPLVSSINAELGRLLPRSPSLTLRVSSTDSRGVLAAVIAHFKSGDCVAIPASRQGSGLVSLQALLLLLELGGGRSAEQGFLMAVEEPELHVPAPSQGRLVRRIQALSAQSIVTTHAPAVAAAGDPTAVLILRNDAGRLVANPFLEAPLTGTAPNWLRRYFYQNRYAMLAALLHESVLIPEGRSDHGLLTSVGYALDLRQTWAESTPPSFALEVGVVPTEDAKVVETCPLISRVHDRVCCLVDGDEDGDRYAEHLRALPDPPRQILQWPRGWAIEKAVGWVAEADAVGIMRNLGELATPPTSVDDLVNALIANKAKPIVYEIVASAIAETPACAAKANELLGAIALVCAGKPTPHFQRGTSGVLTFVP